jgi:hypothetical protein
MGQLSTGPSFLYFLEEKAHLDFPPGFPRNAEQLPRTCHDLTVLGETGLVHPIPDAATSLLGKAGLSDRQRAKRRPLPTLHSRFRIT